MLTRKLSLVTALSLLAAGSLASGQAFAGASASAPTKNVSHPTHLASDQHHSHKSSQSASVEITQFTSSSHKH